MLKFLRKYNKITLVVFGSLLMVVFLLPQALSQLGQNINKRTVARIEATDTKVSMLQRTKASGEQTMLSRIAYGPMGPLGLGLLGSDDLTDHWLLFSHEAESAGLVGNEQEGIQFLDSVAQVNARLQVAQQISQFGLSFQQAVGFLNQPQFAQQVAMTQEQMAPELRSQIGLIGGSIGLNTRESAEAIAKLSGTYRLVNLHNDAAMPSLPRVQAFARDRDDAAITDLMFIPSAAADAIAEPLEPSESEILAHFDRYRDVAAGTIDEDANDGDFGFGYRRSDRVKLSWLTLPRSIFEDAITLDPVEVRRRFLEQEEAAAGDEAFPSFETMRPAIERELITERADRLMDETVGIIRGLLQRSVDSLERTSNDDAYIVPEDWTPADFAEIARVAAQELNESTSLNFEPFPTTTRDENWLDSNELSQLPGIGNARIEVGGNGVAFPIGAMIVRELGSPSPLFPLQVGVPAYEFPVASTRGDRFFFTILDVRNESAPDSVEEVREAVIRDLKRAMQFTTLQDWSSELNAILLTRGIRELEQVVLDRVSAVPGLTATARASVEERVRVSRRPGQAAPVDALRVERIRNEIVSQAETLDPTVDPLTLTDAEATMLLEVPELAGLLAVRIRAFEPLTAEQYRQFAQTYILEFTRSEFNDTRFEDANLDIAYPFELDSLTERLGFVEIGGDGPAESTAAPEPSDTNADDGESSGAGGPGGEGDESGGSEG